MALLTGKLPPPLLSALLTDATDDDVLLGPAVGEDAAALSVADGVLVAATDPITLTSSDVGWYAVIVNANDVAVMGVRPRWFLASVLLPDGTASGDLEPIFDGLYRALAEVGAVLVGGHTEVTGAVRQPVVVGQMLGWRADARFVSSAGVGPGDVVLQIGAAPIEGAAVLAQTAADTAAEGNAEVDAEVLAQAGDAIRNPGLSVVDEALWAADFGATGMHDPTEGGLAAALHELATAAGVGLRVDRDAAVWFEPGVAVCGALGADPWATLASGSLLAAFAPQRVHAAESTLRARGVAVGRIATATRDRGVHDLAGRPLPLPERDEVARLS